VRPATRNERRRCREIQFVPCAANPFTVSTRWDQVGASLQHHIDLCPCGLHGFAFHDHALRALTYLPPTTSAIKPTTISAIIPFFICLLLNRNATYFLASICRSNLSVTASTKAKYRLSVLSTSMSRSPDFPSPESEDGVKIRRDRLPQIGRFFQWLRAWFPRAVRPSDQRMAKQRRKTWKTRRPSVPSTL